MIGQLTKNYYYSNNPNNYSLSVDQELLLGLLELRKEKDRPRIGAIGSTSKWKSFRKAAIDYGIEEKWFNNARCPIGIDIGAETPEEIGLAVCAEILSLEKKITNTEN